MGTRKVGLKANSLNILPQDTKNLEYLIGHPIPGFQSLEYDKDELSLCKPAQ
jgi:hypothetical protein